MTLWATMPKTAINKYCYFLIWKGYIWLACNILNILSPIADPHPCKHGAKSFFKLCALALDGFHGFAPVFRFEVVAHFPAKRVAQQASRADIVASHFQPMDSRHVRQSRILRAHKPHRQTR